MKTLKELKSISDYDLETLELINKQGTNEGWFIGENDADWLHYRLEHDTEAGKFCSDMEAVRYVTERALNGSVIHNNTLEFMAKYAEPIELDFIIKSALNKI